MDRTSIIVLAVCLLVLLLWWPLLNKVFPPKPLPPGSTNAPLATLAPTNLPATSAVAPPSLEIATNVPLKVVANTNEPEQLLELTNSSGRYTFTSHGGGLQQVEVLLRDKQTHTNHGPRLNTADAAPTLAILGGDAIQGDGVFQLTSPSSNSVRAEKALTNGLTIVKQFDLSTNYLIAATVRFENHSSAPLNLPAQEWVVGTATPMDPRDNGQAVGVLWYNGSGVQDISSPWFANRTLGCLPGTPRSEYRDGATNVQWVAAHNQYFTLAAMPKDAAYQVVIRKMDLARPSGPEASMVATNAPLPTGYPASLLYPGLTLAPNQVVERQVFIFAGPKEYRTLARIGARFGNNIDLVMNFGFWGFFSKALLLAMNWLHQALKFSYGWAIVVITIVIKVLFWPLTQASTRSMKRMQALQPQMKALQEKYKEDPVRMNRKLMEFMKEHKVSPLGGCLPMVLQIPVFFGFYRMIQSAIELRNAPFLWVRDLSKSDTLFVIPGLGGLPFVGIPGVGLPFNVLPLVMGATMLWQARLTPPSPGMDPMQQKMMRYMPLMFMLFLYNFSAGLTLYWTVQNLLTIAQTKLTRPAPESTAPPTRGQVLTPQLKKRK